MLKQIQKTFFKILEKELLIVLAVLVLALFTFWVNAAGDSITFSLSVIPAGGTITVTYPNGGEDWKINTTETITWTTQGSITDVKIELQRMTGGSWEELIASTTNDGSFPWPVTSPTTTQALIKVSKVGDATVNDTSNAIFTISSASGGGGGGGGGGISNPAIDTVVPREFSNAADVDMIITGVYFEWGAKVWLDNHYLQPTGVQPGEILLVIPVGFPMDEYILCVQNLSGGRSCYHLPVIIYDEQYEASIVDQFNSDLVLLPNEQIETWITLRNNSNYVWSNTGNNPLRLGVINDQSSIFYDSITWVTLNRAARLEENEVNYGETGTFRFYIKAPGEVGEYDEFFVPVIENVKWLTAPEIKWHVRVVPMVEEIITPSTGGEEEIYSAKWLRQSPYPALEHGEEATLWVDFRNTGNMPWDAHGDYPIRLGTSRSLDRISDFGNGNWISNNRPVQARNNGVSWLVGDGTVQPGEIGRFTFTIIAFNGPGKYREYFRPVVEYKTWMEDWGIYWDITIRGKVEPPTTGGIVELKKPEPPQNELKLPKNKVFIKVEKQYPTWIYWLLSRLGFI